MGSRAPARSSRGGGDVPGSRLFCCALFFTAAAPFFFTDNPILQTNDNLDGANLVLLHILKQYGAVFSFDTEIPIMHGLSRLFFPAEFKVWGFLFAFCDDFLQAYRINLLLKIAVGYGSMLLFLSMFAPAEQGGPALRRLVAACFAVLPCQPENALSCASLPLVFCLFRALYLRTGPHSGAEGAVSPHDRDERRERRRALSPPLLLAGAACYPLLSDCSRFGLYILSVLTLWFLYDAIVRKSFRLAFAAGIVLLGLGYVLTEYRLFYTFFWLDPETVREEFRHGSYSYFDFRYTLRETFELLLDGQYHFAATAHKYIVLPVVLVFMLASRKTNDPGYALAKRFFAAFVAIIIVKWIYLFCVVEVLDAHIRLLRFIQLDRVYIFLPLILYSLFYLTLARAAGYLGRGAAALCAAAQAVCIIATPAIYNDTLRNLRHDACLAGEFGYREYFSESLFRTIKEKTRYAGEWSVGVGISPSVLAVNGIHTLDGYHGYYPLAYKYAFRELIAPELAENAATREYFDYWGCRAYVFNEAANAPGRTPVSDPVTVRMDPGAFGRLGGRYVFSRVRIGNSGELGLVLAGEFSDESSPYVIYLYEAAVAERNAGPPHPARG